LTFAVSVTALGITWQLASRVLAKKLAFRSRPIHKGTLIGGALFGLGWALSGACPSIVFVQLGEGQLGGVLTFAGMFAGNWIYSLIHERYLRWDTGSCIDE
jgi:uncharacterized membrane protein YedE/YeeE